MDGGVVGGSGGDAVGDISGMVWRGLGEAGSGDRHGEPPSMDVGQGEMIPGAGDPPPWAPGVGEDVAPIRCSEWPRCSSAWVAASVTPLCFCSTNTSTMLVVKI